MNSLAAEYRITGFFPSPKSDVIAFVCVSLEESENRIVFTRMDLSVVDDIRLPFDRVVDAAWSKLHLRLAVLGESGIFAVEMSGGKVRTTLFSLPSNGGYVRVVPLALENNSALRQGPSNILYPASIAESDVLREIKKQLLLYQGEDPLPIQREVLAVLNESRGTVELLYSWSGQVVSVVRGLGASPGLVLTSDLGIVDGGDVLIHRLPTSIISPRNELLKSLRDLADAFAVTYDSVAATISEAADAFNTKIVHVRGMDDFTSGCLHDALVSFVVSENLKPLSTIRDIKERRAVTQRLKFRLQNIKALEETAESIVSAIEKDVVEVIHERLVPLLTSVLSVLLSIASTDNRVKKGCEGIRTVHLPHLNRVAADFTRVARKMRSFFDLVLILADRLKPSKKSLFGASPNSEKLEDVLAFLDWTFGQEGVEGMEREFQAVGTKAAVSDVLSAIDSSYSDSPDPERVAVLELSGLDPVEVYGTGNYVVATQRSGGYNIRLLPLGGATEPTDLAVVLPPGGRLDFFRFEHSPEDNTRRLFFVRHGLRRLEWIKFGTDPGSILVDLDAETPDDLGERFYSDFDDISEDFTLKEAKVSVERNTVVLLFWNENDDRVEIRVVDLISVEEEEEEESDTAEYSDEEEYSSTYSTQFE